MKRVILTIAVALVSLGANAQLKKDGTPDMRYKSNKMDYQPTFSTPPPRQQVERTYPSDRNYQSGGQIKVQDGYFKSNGTYVAPHFKTNSDNSRINNLPKPRKY